MKKLILFAAILFAGVSVVKAADPVGTSTANENTRLTVTLNPFQTISVNHDLVDIPYLVRKDYAEGVTVKKEGHLKIYSTGGFTVKVNSLSENLTGVGNAEKTLGSDFVTVTALKEASNVSGGGGFTATSGGVDLSETGGTLFTSKGGADLVYDIEYFGKPLNTNFDLLFNGTSVSVYETTVTYTIVAN